MMFLWVGVVVFGDHDMPVVVGCLSQDAAELDQLVIAPSQDYFDGDDEARDDSDAATQPQQKLRSFVEFQDRTWWLVIREVVVAVSNALGINRIGCVLIPPTAGQVSQWHDECSEVFDGAYIHTRASRLHFTMH